MFSILVHIDERVIDDIWGSFLGQPWGYWINNEPLVKEMTWK
jgi:hypothetical protein